MFTYRIFRRSTGEAVETVEAHVLAKAYRAAWRSSYATEPRAQHGLERLDLVIDFGRATSRGCEADPTTQRDKREC